ncbi:hypothetical protein [uncultured Pontibacter sp.]|uniref:hypothetical protein n=1 Tax=uncultured Pontibacter sp. TaxID=453356 RepID=UPI0026094C4A|nr:hypothetical protein [uncultured Pontibacter sp.]
MKFQKLLTFLFALLLITSLSSCKKDDDKGPSKRDMLTAGEWRGASVWWNGTDITNELREAEEFPFDVSQLYIKFDKVGTYLDTYSGVTDNGTWEFTQNEESLLLDRATSFESTVRITNLTDTEFSYIESYDTSGDSDFEFRFTR